MHFPEGTSGNPQGRPKGSANKATAAAREAIAAALSGATAAKLATELDALTGKDYIDAYVKLAEFVTPKLTRTALDAHVSGLTAPAPPTIVQIVRHTAPLPEAPAPGEALLPTPPS